MLIKDKIDQKLQDFIVVTEPRSYCLLKYQWWLGY